MKKINLMYCFAALQFFNPTNILANETISLTNNKDILPTIVLSDSIGLTGSEFFSSGSPKVMQHDLIYDENIDAIVYIEIDSLIKNPNPQLIKKINDSIEYGLPVILDSNSFNIDGLNEFIEKNIELIDHSNVNDVTILIQRVSDSITIKAVTSNQLKKLAGLEPTILETENSDLSNELDSNKNGTFLNRNRQILADHLNFSTRAYEDNPRPYRGYELLYNGVFVDIWKKNGYDVQTQEYNTCYVAWRGTSASSTGGLWDIYADLRSQLSWSNTHIHNTPNGYGGAGFVNRINHYDWRVNTTLNNNGCINVRVTGHSLGAALAQVYTYQTFYNQNLKYKMKSMIVFNSPNALNYNTKEDFYSARPFNFDYRVYCRNHDMLVNRVPTNLYKVGFESADIPGCTSIGPGTRTYWNLNLNHKLTDWYRDFNLPQ